MSAIGQTPRKHSERRYHDCSAVVCSSESSQHVIPRKPATEGENQRVTQTEESRNQRKQSISTSAACISHSRCQSQPDIASRWLSRFGPSPLSATTGTSAASFAHSIWPVDVPGSDVDHRGDTPTTHQSHVDPRHRRSTAAAGSHGG